MLNKPYSPYIGAAYYPESWPAEYIDTEIQKMKETGCNCMRLAEFAWSSMEPREGQFDFAWLHNVVEKLHAADIAVILCTPSATPPKWLTDKYEETLLMNSNGVRAQFGARCHICKSSEIMREKNRVIVTKMCEEFKFHPAVIGWQIDNEIYPYKDGCFCPKCKSKFIRYLKDKYKEIGNLNEGWGAKRWSLDYSSFEDVIPPRSDTWNHPSLEVEWLRFGSDNIVSYVEEQSQIIKKYFNVPVGTDMMPVMGTDYYKVNKTLDVVQFNHYEPKDSLHHPSMWFDFLRPIKERPFWNTETQAGWNGRNVGASGYRPKGNCYVNTWLPVAKGGEMNLYWHWRAHPAGHEIGHGAVLSATGRYYHIADEIKKASAEFEKCSGILNGTKIKSDIALTFSASSWLNFKYAPLVEGIDYIRSINCCHKALRHYNVDLIDTPHSLDGYKTLISPMLSCAEENGFKERALEWVKEGGTWIIGPMSDIMTDYAAKYTNAPYSFLEEVAGIYTKYQVPVPNDVFKAEWADGSELKVSQYYDGYELRGAESLAVYTNDCLNGLSLITKNKYGKGYIIAVGAFIDGEALKKLINIKPIFSASSNIELVKREGLGVAVICLELENKEGVITLDREYTDLITNKVLHGQIKLSPHQVLVLKDALY